MKKLILFGLLIGLGFGVNAQNADFGITAGYLNVRGSVKSDDVSVSASESGFYAGILVDFELTETFHIQPELLYASANGANAIFFPVLGKFYLNDKVNLQAGPQLVFATEEVPDDFTGTEFDLAGGLGVDILPSLFTEIRYTFQINNSYTGSGDIKVRGNYLTLGVGYTF
ncbi:MAG: outer membrane beta-barrel protein [Flavobacteriaceae bacterium]